VLELRTFYGQLQHIIVLRLDPSDVLGLLEPTSVILAAIRNCTLEPNDAQSDTLDIHYYTQNGRLEAVDITCVQCAVGRVKDRGRWAIIDRSGSLARALFVGE